MDTFDTAYIEVSCEPSTDASPIAVSVHITLFSALLTAAIVFWAINLSLLLRKAT